MKSSSFTRLPLLLLAALAQTTTHRAAAMDIACERDSICISSFVRCATGDGGGCDPIAEPDALMPGVPTTDFTVLYHGAKYEVRWREAWPDHHVWVEWLFDRGLFDKAGRSGGKLNAMWSINVTRSSPDGSFMFDPLSILKSFPTAAASDVSPEHAATASSGILNTIRVSQPGSRSSAAASYTKQFTLLPEMAAQAMSNVESYQQGLRAEDNRRWRLGAGIGVGLGLPLWTGFVWILAARWQARHTAPIIVSSK